MKLSELKTGERGVIVKVMGHGGFRKRIVEMGFIKGKVVDVLLNAPLQDPVKYKIMGYEVSLRRSEAEMIEVISVEEAAEIEKNKPKVSEPLEKGSDGLSDTQLRDAAMKKRRTITSHLSATRIVERPHCSTLHQEPTSVSATILALLLMQRPDMLRSKATTSTS